MATAKKPPRRPSKGAGLRVGKNADETWLWRDARQIAQVDAFFRGERAPGPVGICSWRWSSFIGRDAALAFLSTCPATFADAEKRRNVAAVADVWKTTLFSEAPEQFRVLETVDGELPFVLPRDASGYNHHAVEWRGARYFLYSYPQGDRVIMTPKGGMALCMIEQRAGRSAAADMSGFIDRQAEPAQPGILQAARALCADRGPVPRDRKTSTALAERIRVARKVADGLLTGDLLLARVSDRNAGVDWERVVDVTNAAFDVSPEQWWTPEGRAALIDRFAARWRQTAALDKRLADVRALKLGKLSPKVAKQREVAPTGRLSTRAQRWLTANVGRPDVEATSAAAALAAEVQQVRFNRGIDAFGKLLAKLAAELGDEAPEALEFIYQHVEHSH